MILAFTGHRPDRIKNALNEVYAGIQGLLISGTYTHVISGMAQGVDQIGAAWARALLIPWTAAVPFPGQKDRWPPEQRAMYERLIESASRVVTTSESYHGGVYHIRDRWMVDNCDVLAAVWDGIERGGTWETVKYARRVGRRILYLDLKTGMFSEPAPM